MKLTVMTIIIAALSCLQIIRIISKTRRDAIGIRPALIWILMWIAIGLGSLFPSAVDYFMQAAQMRDRMFFILLLSVLILFALVFNLASGHEKLQRDVSKLIQEVAILRYNMSESPQNKAAGKNDQKDEPEKKM